MRQRDVRVHVEASPRPREERSVKKCKPTEAPVYTWLDPNQELDEIGMKFSCNVFDAFIHEHNGLVTAAQIHEAFDVDASLFTRLMDERILPNDCAFVSTYGRIHKIEEVYVFPEFGSSVCSYCLT